MDCPYFRITPSRNVSWKIWPLAEREIDIKPTIDAHFPSEMSPSADYDEILEEGRAILKLLNKSPS
jgi:hypothetical protein